MKLNMPKSRLVETPIRIDVGCGYHKKPGFIGIDANPKCRPDIVIDLSRERIPLPDDSVEEVYSYDAFEHIPNLYWTRFAFNLEKELYRVCRHGAIMNIYVPHYQARQAIESQQHFRFPPFCETTFDYYDRSQEKRNDHIPEPINFRVLGVKVIRGKIRFWKPYLIHFRLMVVKE